MKDQITKSVKNSIKYWYVPLIVGLLFIGIGIYTIVTPLLTYVILALLFSASFLASGISEIIFSISNRKEIDNWGWVLSLGILTAIIGFLLLIHPEISVVTLPFYVGFLVLFRSIGAIGFSLDLKNYGILEWGNLMLIGVLGVLFSLLLLWNPIFAGMTVVFWTGVSLISCGFLSSYFSFNLRKLKKLGQQQKAVDS